ncbi:MAG: serpin family protein [Victivallaceae bacterium]|nr:serpin family protein [Victivallaceae bacterium]
MKICKSYLMLILSVIFIILLTGVSKPPVLISEYQRKVNINYRFSMNLLRALNRKAPKDNYIVSPLGIENNLAVLYVGSTGKTNRQIAELLATSDKPLEFLNQQRKRMDRLVKVGMRDKITFEYANIILADNTFCESKKDFEKNINASEFCKLGTVRYKDKENTIARVNEWCRESTHGHIETIISPEDIKSKSSFGVINEPFFTLLSAIYFKGDWLSRFNENTNNKFPFYCEAGASGEMIYMMEQNNSELEYAESKDIKILKMYFKGNDFSLLIVLPKKIMSAKQLLTQISSEEIEKTSNCLSPCSVNVKMPKFEMKNKIELKSVMEDSGFTEMDNFASMFVCTFVALMVHIDTMKQKNYFAVDEKGAEASSVTYTQGFSVGCAAGIPTLPPVEFTMDRPFLYFLQHEDCNSGTVLFAGCYAKPSEHCTTAKKP